MSELTSHTASKAIACGCHETYPQLQSGRINHAPTCLVKQGHSEHELLEALRNLLAECDRQGCFGEVGFDFPTVKPVFDAARAAVAKAEACNTPNYCPKCTPVGLGYCRCAIASNE